MGNYETGSLMLQDFFKKFYFLLLGLQQYFQKLLLRRSAEPVLRPRAQPVHQAVRPHLLGGQQRPPRRLHPRADALHGRHHAGGDLLVQGHQELRHHAHPGDQERAGEEPAGGAHGQGQPRLR